MKELKDKTRYLGRFETAQALTDSYSPFNVVAVLHLENGPAPGNIKNALNVLQSRHPALDVRLGKQKNRFYFQPGDVPPLPCQFIEQMGPNHWKTIVEAELNKKIDAFTGPLARCTCLYRTGDAGKSAAEIIMTFHHAIVDAASGARLLHRLLDLAASAAPQVPGCEDNETRTTLQKPAEYFFPPRFKGIRMLPRGLSFLVRQMRDEMTFRRKRKKFPGDMINDDARCRILTMQLTGECSSALARRCRKERVTLTDALSTAQLLAVRKHRFQDAEIPCRIFSFADLRPFLNPPMTSDYLGSYFTMMRFTVSSYDGGTFWTRVKRLNRRTLTAYKRGDKFLYSFFSPMVMKMVINMKSQRMGAAGLSYSGPLEIDETYGNTRVNDFHAFVSNLSLGPEYTGLARLFRGSIYFDLVYLDTDMDAGEAQTIAGEMRSILEQAVSCPTEES
jgi:hypothetical protein